MSLAAAHAEASGSSKGRERAVSSVGVALTPRPVLGTNVAHVDRGNSAKSTPLLLCFCRLRSSRHWKRILCVATSHGIDAEYK